MSFLTSFKRRPQKIRITQTDFLFYNRNVRNVKPMVRFCDAVSLMPFIYLLLTRDITLTSNQAETSVMKFFKEVIAPTKIGNNPSMSNSQKLMFAKQFVDITNGNLNFLKKCMTLHIPRGEISIVYA